MADSNHWDDVYRTRGAAGVSWYRPHLDRSLQFVRDAQLQREASIIDVGAGASTFVDDLIHEGYQHLTVVDLSATAIAAARSRLGEQASKVVWLEGDIIRIRLPRGGYDLWHDRAVFHFLREPDQRRRYVEQVKAAVKPGGHVVVATFGPRGPERCSGLDVVRYDAEGLHDAFGPAFRKVSSDVEVHRTPWGSEQEFVYCYCRVVL